MSTMNRLQTSAVFFLMFLSLANSWGDYGKDKVKLRDVQVLTLYHGRMTTGRRNSPIPQLKCIGGSAGCGAFVPQVVQCTNKGSDGFDVQWECKTDMDNLYRFGRVEVACEGYDHPDDEYILKGSCGLEYTLDLTKEGMHKQQDSHNYYGNSHNSYKPNPHSGYTYGDKTSAMGSMIIIAVVGIILYALYKTCIASTQNSYGESAGYTDPRGPPPPYGFGGGGGGGSGNNYGNPPPPGFRSDYGSSSDSCHGNRGTGSSGGGFWTGAATGGLLGYMFGNRNSGSGYRSGYNTGYNSRPSAPSYDNWGGFGGGSTSGFGGSGDSSSGTRTATGFGGTRRR